MGSSHRSLELFPPLGRHLMIPRASQTGMPDPYCTVKTQIHRPAPLGVGRCSFLSSDCDALLRSSRLCGIELPIALFDAAGPLVPGNRGADMVRASALA